MKLMFTKLFAFTFLLLFSVSAMGQNGQLVQLFGGKGQEILGDMLYYDSQNLFIAGSYGANLTINDSVTLQESDDPMDGNSRLIHDAFIGRWDPQKPGMKWVKTLKHCNSDGPYILEFLGNIENQIFFQAASFNCDSFVYDGKQVFHKAEDQDRLEVIGRMDKAGRIQDALNIEGVIFRSLKVVNDSLVAAFFENIDTVANAEGKTLWQAKEGSVTIALMKKDFSLVNHQTIYANNRTAFSGAYMVNGTPRFMGYFSGDTITTSGSISVTEGYSVFEYDDNLTLNRLRTAKAPFINLRVGGLINFDDGFGTRVQTNNFRGSVQLKDTTLKGVKGASETSYLLKFDNNFNLKDFKVVYSDSGGNQLEAFSKTTNNKLMVGGTYMGQANLFQQKVVTTSNLGFLGGIEGYFLAEVTNEPGGLKIGEITTQKGFGSPAEYSIEDISYVPDQGATYFGGLIEGNWRLGKDSGTTPTGLADAFVHKLVDQNNTSAELKPAKAEPEVQVYPNPAGDQMTIEAGERPIKAGAELVIYDVLGHVVKRDKLNRGHTTLSIQQLPPGSYYLKGKAGDTTFTKKFIKQ